MLRYFTLIALIAMIALPAMAKDDGGVMIDLAIDHVDITTGFNGSYISLYGVKDKPGDIAIAIKGPEGDMVVRKKQKIFGVWTNTGYMRFKGMPVYYDYALATPDTPPASKEVMSALGLGLEAMYKPVTDKRSPEEVKVFQDALVRNKQSEGRFSNEPASITFLKDNFFKATFYVPANVPTGDYTVETFLFQDGGLQDIKTSRLTVAQVGTSASIYSFSKKHSFFYGLLCVIFAMSAGWVSNAIRRT